MSPLWIPLLPVMALQGLAVRRRALRLPEPDGPRQGRSGDGVPLRLLILGDSAAAGVGTERQSDALLGQLVGGLQRDHDIEWRLLARTGATTASTLRALDTLGTARFDVVVTSLGVNDVTGGISATKFVQQQSALIDHLRGHLRADLVLASGLPPVHRFPALPQPLRGFLGQRARQFDAALAALAGRRGDFVHVPLDIADALDRTAMAVDGFHPGPPAYRDWARKLEVRIRADATLARWREGRPETRQ